MKYPAILAILFSLLADLGCATQSTNSSDIGGFRSRHGAAEARKDIADNKMELKAYGLPQPATEQYAALLKKDLNITYQQIGGCMVDHNLTKYANDYNEVILAYVAKKYGKKATLDLWDRAKSEYEADIKKGGG